MHSVLIVDDAMFMRMMLKDILTKNGFEVVGEAETGEEAILKYRELRPDLVTMDIVMPKTDGIDAVRSIIQEDPGAHIVICSAMGQQSLVQEALQNGASDYIIKPFSPAKVVEVMTRVAQGG